jgi:membrane fusion protein, multidrug efflux system
MASSIFRPSRIIAVALVGGAAIWIGSGAFGPAAEEESAEATAQAAAEVVVPVQKVAVVTATPEQHQRRVILSCVTEADHQAKATARGAGVIVDLRISRGDMVSAGQVVATISDEGREAGVLQAKALLDQRMAEYDANKRLIDLGNTPKNQLPVLESAVAAAKAALSSAEAEAEKTTVKSPISGVADTVLVQVGQAVQVGDEIATIVDPDPMLAVGAVSEARRGSIKTGQSTKVRFIDGSVVDGKVQFVGVSADTATRTYPVEAKMDNAAGTIADGVTCEMTVTLPPLEATAVPRSALIFSDEGYVGIRIADGDNKAQFIPVDIADDGREVVWVTGVDRATRVIIVGQDFVKNGDPVEAVSATESEMKASSEPPA